uniref:Isoleucine--tRNA ligase cytoplasmic ubiquitin-like domain-containing protein n=1 Tax=Hucho hucho TaxID=62062 RepID=A0A4W5MVK0_9TELE
MVLGKRLKGAFKSITASIKELKSDQLETFQKTGTIVVDGHELHEEDLRLMYSFNQTSGSATQYEAHSDSQVLVLLDVTPDQSMLDEGVAREVINRIQKLRKKGHLVPSDEITVYYSCDPAGDYLDTVIQAHTDFILATTKAPLKTYPVPKGSSVIVQEKTALIKEVTKNPMGLHFFFVLSLSEGVVLLENPKGDTCLDMAKLRQVCSSLFGLNNTKLCVFNELTGKCDVLSLNGKTLSVTSGSSPSDSSPNSDSLVCPYVNLQLANCQPAECQSGDVGTLLLVNPVGHDCLTHNALLSETAKLFGLRSRRLKLYLDDALTQGKTDTTRPKSYFGSVSVLSSMHLGWLLSRPSSAQRMGWETLS